MEIRKATPQDLEDILRLNLDLFKKEHKEYDKSWDLKWTYSKDGKDYFNKRITENGSFAWVAEERGKMVGYLCGGLNVRNCRVKEKHAELDNMIVAKKYRNLGIGKKLVE